MTFRSRKAEIAYKKHRKLNKTTGCPFCSFNLDDGQVIGESDHFWIVKNIFGYSIWEGLPVRDHLMIVPKGHIDSLAHFTDDESAEYMELVSRYDDQGYSTYTRSTHNIAKSVQHLHTHLLKLGNRHVKMSVYLHRPYLLWHR